MRLTEFTDPNAYSLPAEDNDDFNGRHQHERPNGATDQRPPSPRRAKTLKPISRRHSSTRYGGVSNASTLGAIPAIVIV
jgi:hypothetical protein